MLVMATLGVANAILIGASLSFIGIGVIDDRPDWGFLLSQGRSYLTVAWWFATLTACRSICKCRPETCGAQRCRCTV